MAQKITLDLIKKVRNDTGAGMMDVKKALTEAEGDPERAKEILRANGVQAAGKREGRKAQEGLVAAKIVEEDGKQVCYAIEFNSETDFVAETPQFVKYGDEILDAAIAVKATSVDDVLAAATADGTVQDTITSAGALFKEHVKIGKFVRIEGDHIDLYAHKKSAEFPPSTVAIIATDENGASVAHDVALQISAMSPRWLSSDDVPQEILDRETRIASEKCKAEGKPDKIIPMIVKGRLNSFFEESVLLNQKYVKDGKKTIADLFKEVGGKAEAFARIEVGKSEEDSEE